MTSVALYKFIRGLALGNKLTRKMVTEISTRTRNAVASKCLNTVVFPNITESMLPPKIRESDTFTSFKDDATPATMPLISNEMYNFPVCFTTNWLSQPEKVTKEYTEQMLLGPLNRNDKMMLALNYEISGDAKTLVVMLLSTWALPTFQYENIASIFTFLLDRKLSSSNIETLFPGDNYYVFEDSDVYAFGLNKFAKNDAWVRATHFKAYPRCQGVRDVAESALGSALGSAKSLFSSTASTDTESLSSASSSSSPLSAVQEGSDESSLLPKGPKGQQKSWRFPQPYNP